MKIMLSASPAQAPWKINSLITVGEANITIHAMTNAPKLERIQAAARKIYQLGLKQVLLAGEGWQLDESWAFWCGFYAPKQVVQLEWEKALCPSAATEFEHRNHIVGWVRNIINQPAEVLSPQQLAEEAITLLTQVSNSQHIKTAIISGENLRTAYPGIYCVGKGSVRAPLLLQVDYDPLGKGSSPTVCLVGKGITFDSGGYSIKPSVAMETMRADMGGAALLTGSLALAIARGLHQPVRLYLCCAENMISSAAMKLGDIIHYSNGKSVEINNSDAEGRLVLADGLIAASKSGAKTIIDAATLTGAAKMALGHEYHALFSFDNQLTQQLLEVADQTGEGFWRLPLKENHRHQLCSDFADLSNISSSSFYAGASTAAAFLSHFVTQYQQGWLHIDCAANFWKGGHELWAAGATGIGVLTLSAWLNSIAKK